MTVIGELMTPKERFQLRSYVLAIIMIVLGAVSILIIWHLLTGDYPTHSDIFWIGVQTGVLGMLLVIIVFLILAFSYRLLTLRKHSSCQSLSSSTLGK